ncbi:MAG: hypothetical protein H6712_05630 [Myxococcales bacterium]|nr:hypothetical protein [Myxococcales bacterium]MCB9713315.1 hypothetical protein [Myxococcales bacterium]
MRPSLGLALLLGATALGCGDDLPTAPESGSSGTTTGAVGTTTGADTTTGGHDEGTGTSAAASSSSTGGSEGGSSEGTTGDSGSESSGSGSSTGEGIDPCAQGCVTEFACGTEWTSEEECVIACQANLDKAGAFSIACRAAWEDLAVCLGTLTCEDFGVWQAPMALPYPCSDEDILLQIECKGQ